MSEFNTAYHNQVDYYLNSPLGRRKITEPEGWKSDLMEYARSKENSGIVNKISTDLKFVKDGADYLTELVKNYGSEVDCTLEKWITHPKEMKRVRSYRAYIDLTEYEYKDERVSIKAQKSGLLNSINTYKNEKVELERLDALNGNALQPLDKVNINIEGKKILLVSELTLGPDDNIIQMNLASDNLHESVTVLFNKQVSNSDKRVHNVSEYDIVEISSAYQNGSAGNMFYADNDRVKTLELDIDIDFDYSHNHSIDFIRIELLKYSGGTNFDYESTEVITGSYDSNSNLSYKGKMQIKDLPVGYSLAFAVFVYSQYDVLLTFNKANLTITENSWFPPTINKGVLPYERIERLLQIITGRTDKNLFYSECFGRKDLGYAEDGEYAYLTTSTGFWARGFNEENITTSWKDTMDSFYAIKGISFGLQINGDVETILVEPLNFFYQTGKVFDFPLQASKESRKIAKEFQYTSIDIGYQKGGADYEEAMGLDEPNGKHSYTSPFQKSSKKLSLLSKDRADMTGYEFARRKPKINFPTEDTNYDKDNFILSCKMDGNNLVQTKWQDFYEVEPENVYSPETFPNLDLTPKRNLLNHGWWLNGGLFNYRTQNLKYASSEGNSTLITKKANQDYINENGDLPISLLDSPKFTTEWIEFEHFVDFELAELLEGNTLINGRWIPNVYFEWRIKNDKGDFEKVRIWDVKPNKEGKFKCLIVR